MNGTHLRDGVKVKIANFYFCANNRTCRKGGGTSVYCDKESGAQQTNRSQLTPMEATTVVIHTRNQEKINVIIAYKIPNKTLNTNYLY